MIGNAPQQPPAYRLSTVIVKNRLNPFAIYFQCFYVICELLDICLGSGLSEKAILRECRPMLMARYDVCCLSV